MTLTYEKNPAFNSDAYLFSTKCKFTHEQLTQSHCWKCENARPASACPGVRPSFGKWLNLGDRPTLTYYVDQRVPGKDQRSSTQRIWKGKINPRQSVVNVWKIGHMLLMTIWCIIGPELNANFDTLGCMTGSRRKDWDRSRCCICWQHTIYFARQTHWNNKHFFFNRKLWRG